MNVLILEDEKAAATRLRQLLQEAEPSAHVIAVLESVKETVKWLSTNPQPDLILSDIQLADGLSFEALRLAGTTTPVIFTTAYDAYTLNAFKLNSIDYLLKPIDKDELRAAFAKYHTLNPPTKKMLDLIRDITTGRTAYRSRFLIRQGERLLTVPIEEVAYIRADDKVVFLHTTKGKKHIIDDPLDILETTLDPALFFRLNRTYIAPLASIEKISTYFNGRLKISLAGSDDEEIVVSRARAAAFKSWLDK